MSDQREAFEKWASEHWGSHAYLHTSNTSGEWDAWQAALTQPQPQAQQAAAVPAGFKLQVMDAADVYAKCAAKAHAERLYGTSTSYTNECTKRENEMRTSLQSLLAAAPPPPVLPLSDEHIDKIREALVEKMLAARMLVGDDAWDAWDHSLARAIERAHGVTEPGAGGEGV